MKIKLNNDMELVLNNENGTGACIASLVDSDGEILRADVIDEQGLFEHITNQMSAERNPWAMKVAELRSLKEGEPIWVCDGHLGYFESFEPTENGDYTIWFTDEGLYKSPENGEYYDLETNEKVSEYIGNCSLGEYIGRFDKEHKLDKAKELINAYVAAEFGENVVADFRDLRHIGLAYTQTDYDGQFDIQVEVNLIDCSIVKFVDWQLVEEVKYDSLSALIDHELEGMSFDDLVYLTDEQLAPFYANENANLVDHIMKAINIEWDVDCEEERTSLPTEIDIPKGMTDEDEISDYISDVTGFCHAGFELIEINKNIEVEKLSLAQTIASAEARTHGTLSANNAKNFEPEL